MNPEPRAEFPQWIEWSGLPEHLYALGKGPVPWLLFHKIVELDIASHRSAPGVIEVSFANLAATTGLPADKTRKGVRVLRKAKVLRAFMPDTDDEDALFEILTPLVTPVPVEELIRTRDELARVSIESMRYALAPMLDPNPSASLNRVVDLYMDLVSMKMNSFILDELRLITERCDIDLVERVFARAKKRGVQSLSWILAELRREKSPRPADGPIGVG